MLCVMNALLRIKARGRAFERYLGFTGLVIPRSLRRIVNTPIPDRNAIIAEGLALLTEHIGQLRLGMDHLTAASQHRTAAILDMIAAEEAAKVLILLDIVRLGWKDSEAVNRQISYFSSHVSRGIYARLAEANLGHFGEARFLVERLREDRYLDGPNDVDWIFRNEIESEREELLYVDYVVYEADQARWVSPANHDAYRHSRPDQGVRLAQAMSRLGMLSKPALDALGSYPWPAMGDAAFTYAQQREETLTFLRQLGAANLLPAEYRPEDVQVVLERWQFPLHSLDLRQRKVSDEELRSRRSRAEDRLWRDYMGDWD
jgi:AbiV family abortive infection protein